MTSMKTLRSVCLSILVLFAAAGVEAREATSFEVAAGEIAAGWIEVTPLGGGDPALGTRFEGLGGEGAEPFVFELEGLGEGLAMVCRSADEPMSERGSWCEEFYLEEGVIFGLDFAPGVRVVGRYLLDGFPLEGVRVAVVPAGLSARRPFTLPLERAGDRLSREVLSDDGGGFELPPLVAGDYFLESITPAGRVHRGDPFRVPTPGELRGELDAESEAALSFDLGDIRLDGGLVVEVVALGADDRALAGAEVTARQGERPHDLVTWSAETGPEGRVEISGFDAQRPASLSCRAPGHRPWRQSWDVIPAQVFCELEPLAAVEGRLIDPGGEPAAGGEVRLTSTKDQGARQVGADAEGAFHLDELEAGSWTLVAAAPELGARELEIDLESGEILDLGEIALGSGRELEGRVVDAETGDPLEGILMAALSPPGVAGTESDGDGEFRLSVPSDQRLVLRTFSEEWVSETLRLEPRQIAGGEIALFELERGGWLRLIVWDVRRDLPCQSCPLEVDPGNLELLTDAWGEAMVGPLAAGSYRVRVAGVEHLGSLVIEEPEALERRVRVEAGEVVTAVIRLGGERLRVRLADAPDENLWLEVRSARGQERRPPEADGTYLVTRRGTERLVFFMLWADPASGGTARVRVGELTGQVDGEVVFRVPDTLVEGRFTSDGEPLAGAKVRLNGLADSALWAEVTTGDDGTWRIPHVPPGGYSLAVGARAVRFLTVSTYQDLDLGTFEILPGSF